MTLFALIHVVRQRPDAFTAVDKATKTTWTAILAGSLFAIIVLWSLYGLMILGLAGVVAAGVYLADVRPKVDEVQRGPRW